MHSTSREREDPISGQTETSIALYISSCVAGSDIAICDSQGMGVRYLICKVEGVNPSIGRIYTDISGGQGGKAWYRKTGKNCFHPKGRSRLVEPTEAVRRFTRLYPIGRMVNHILL